MVLGFDFQIDAISILMFEIPAIKNVLCLKLA